MFPEMSNENASLLTKPLHTHSYMSDFVNNTTHQTSS